MIPTLQKAIISDKELLKSLLKQYFDELGNPHEYKYLDEYWIDINRHPYLIKIDNKVSGFVLVNEKDPQSIPDYPLGIAEFYVLKKI